MALHRVAHAAPAMQLYDWTYSTVAVLIHPTPPCKNDKLKFLCNVFSVAKRHQNVTDSCTVFYIQGTQSQCKSITDHLSKNLILLC